MQAAVIFVLLLRVVPAFAQNERAPSDDPQTIRDDVAGRIVNSSGDRVMALKSIIQSMSNDTNDLGVVTRNFKPNDQAKLSETVTRVQHLLLMAASLKEELTPSELGDPKSKNILRDVEQSTREAQGALVAAKSVNTEATASNITSISPTVSPLSESDLASGVTGNLALLPHALATLADELLSVETGKEDLSSFQQRIDSLQAAMGQTSFLTRLSAIVNDSQSAPLQIAQAGYLLTIKLDAADLRTMATMLRKRYTPGALLDRDTAEYFDRALRKFKTWATDPNNSSGKAYVQALASIVRTDPALADRIRELGGFPGSTSPVPPGSWLNKGISRTLTSVQTDIDAFMQKAQGNHTKAFALMLQTLNDSVTTLQKKIAAARLISLRTNDSRALSKKLEGDPYILDRLRDLYFELSKPQEPDMKAWLEAQTAICEGFLDAQNASTVLDTAANQFFGQLDGQEYDRMTKETYGYVVRYMALYFKIYLAEGDMHIFMEPIPTRFEIVLTPHGIDIQIKKTYHQHGS